MFDSQLNVFVVVADEGSFSKAAEKLFISTTAVIKQINSLEESINLKLFKRSFKGVSLTEAGKSLYSDAKYIIQYLKDSVARAENAMNYEENIIRVGTSIMTPSHLLLEIWPNVHNLYPNLKFKLVSFENTPENAREILANLGQNIDVVAGIFDDTLLDYRQCEALEISEVKFCCAVSVHHRLAEKDKLTIEDLENENLMLIRKGWSSYVDKLRNDLVKNYSHINIVDFPFYNVEVFNQCESENNVLLTVDYWRNVHPLMKVIPVDWDYTIPYGFLHSPEPSPQVESFLKAVIKIINIK
ncbi:MAG: LysR family transcriptional regulator [Clostridia bacterium]|nr:LysR family transcriptional regulator [Clostridia bacterium]